MQFVDIIFFALVAAFLVFQLRRVLGRRDGHEGKRQDPFAPPRERNFTDETVVQLPDKSESDTAEADSPPAPGSKNQAPDSPPAPGPENQSPEDEDEDQSSLGQGMIQIAEADPGFRPEEFLSGARIAFELVLSAFIAGDARALKPLVSADVLANFTHAINDRAKAGEVMEDSLVGIKTVDILEAYMEDAVSHITIKFISEQVNIMRDENGDVVSGNPSVVNDVTDFWTFARDTQSRDPNWILVATRSLD